VKVFLRDTFKTKSLAEWTTFLDGVDVCWAPVRDLHSATLEPHLAARDTIHTDADGAKHLNNPIKFANEPAQPDWRLPSVGEHTAQLTGSHK
jgi:crotonobetainyl-CoA:carnitine CoA-transferase CaiB-like acyl-CoA transferase